MTKIVFCYTIPLTFCFSLKTISVLRDNGFEVTLISSQESELKDVATALHVKYKHLDLSRNFGIIQDIVSVVKLVSILRILKPDIVIGATPKAAIISMIASRFVGVKHRIYHIFGLPYETASGIKRKILTSIEIATSRFASDIIPISHSLHEVYKNKFPFLENKIRNIGSLTVGGVDISKFDRDRFNSEIGSIKSKLGIPKNCLVLGFIGRLTTDKGVGDFIEMWNGLKNKREYIIALIVGSADTRDSYDAKKLHNFLSQDRVYHIEWTTEVEKYFSLIDIFVMPSYREGFGNVNAEASSMGIPVVSYNVTGCKDSVQNGYSGILVEKGDIDSLVSEVISLIDSKEKRQTLGSQGRIFVEENFRDEIVANNFCKYCKTVELNGSHFEKQLWNFEKITKNRKKICFVVSTPFTSKSFLESHFEILSNFYDIFLVANLRDSEIENYSNFHLKEIKHIPIFRKINLFQDIKALILLTNYFNHADFDVIITFTPKAGFIGILSSRFAGIKKRVHFFTGQVWHTKSGLIKIFLRFLDKLIVLFATNIIVDGRPQQEYLIAHNILTENNSIILGKGTISGIDLKLFCPKPDIRNEIRDNIGYNKDDIVFMFLGRLTVDKGILELTKAFNRLQHIYPNVKLIIVGPDEENIIEKLKNEFEVNPNIHYYGSTQTSEKIIQVCDIFCLPSHREAFGLSIIEASACEKPIICSDTYGLKDTIIDGQTGLRHITHDTDSIFEKMKVLVENEALRNTLGVNGRKYIQEFFSKEMITSLWLKYLNSMLN